MPKTSVWTLAIAALLLVLGLGMSGCGPKPLCEGATVTQVQSAQDECAAVTDELDAARDDRARLEAEVSAARAEIAELENLPSSLANRLEELRKGSGR
jgi:septal ring factor EnvC (AmiA/AmiB activator)